MGQRDKGYGSRGRRDRRPSPTSWSSAASFGDPTIDRPTPLTARFDRLEQQVDRDPEEPDRPARHTRADTDDWEPAYRSAGQRTEEFGTGRRDRYGDEPVRSRYTTDAPRAGSDPGWRGDHGGEPMPSPGPDSWRDRGGGRTGSYESPYRQDHDSPYRQDYDDVPPATDAPPRSRHSADESPRRSLRALEEEAARRTREESPQRADDELLRSRTVSDGQETGALLGTYGRGPVDPPAFANPVDPPAFANPVDPPAFPDPAAQPGWNSPEPAYRDDADAGSWRTHQRTEIETWRTEDASAQRWRSETVSWRTRETIEVDTGGVDRFGPRAIGSAESATSAGTDYPDPADLEAWRSETGTWRTGDTAATGSWRLPPATDDLPPATETTDSWGTPPAAETGSWSRSRGRWVPAADETGEQADFAVRRYDDTGEIPKDLLQSAQGRVLDHDEFYDARRRGADSARDGVDRRWDGDASDGRWDGDVEPRRADGIGWRRDDGDGRRAARRWADDSVDAVPSYETGYRSGERLDGRSSGRFGGRFEDDPPATAAWSETGVRRSRRALSAAPDDLDGGYRTPDDESGWRSRSSRYDEDAPGYRSGRRTVGGPRTARHSDDGYDGYDEEDRRRPTRTVARRASAYAGSRGVADNVITPRAAGRGELVPVGRRVAVADEDDTDEVEEAPYGYASAGVASVAWFGLPIGAFLLWAMFLGGTARADCVTAGGQPCAAPRDAAFATFATHLPQIGVAIVLSVVVALLIRLVSPFWRPATVGFAASVVGGGVTTVLFTVLNS